MSATILAVCISDNKGEQKTPVESIALREEHGVVGDAHAGDWHRQVSLLANESVEKMWAKGLEVGPGAFGENLLTSGVELTALPVGTQLAVGEALLEVTQIGKECHTRCAIYHQAGECVMPNEGVFARVLRAGRVVPGSLVTVLPATD